MVVTEAKSPAEILQAIEEKGVKRLAVVGCGSCATIAGTGGKDQVKAMKAYLSEKGLEVLAANTLETACHERLATRLVRQLPEKVQAVVVLACGSGVQNVADVFDGSVIAGLNTLFVGKTKRPGVFLKYCLQCGNCVLNETAGICPKTRCPKGILNGPCGGMFKGRCEVHPENECIWVKICSKVSRENAKTIRWADYSKMNLRAEESR